MNRYSADHNPRTQRRLFISWWRLGISVVVAVLVCTLGALIVTNMQLGRKLAAANERLVSLSSEVAASGKTSRERLKDLTEALELTRTTSLKSEDLAELRANIEKSLGNTSTRVAQLEKRSRSIQDVVANASRSVLFLQGSYTLIEPESGKPLRIQQVGVDRKPVMLAPGIPHLGTDGNGPLYEPIFTGTGFVVSNDGLVITNRHVALPWEHSQFEAMLFAEGIKPKLTRLHGFMPGVVEPFDLTLVKASDDADLALLRCSDITTTVAALAVSHDQPRPGSDIIVMGYPTGLRALLARAGEAYREKSIDEGINTHWELADKLSRDGLINPLANSGIVSQTIGAYIVYDAETTSGGSGGPVLNLDGQVVAVNTAILPDFDGSNLGVPARAVIELIQAVRDAKE